MKKERKLLTGSSWQLFSIDTPYNQSYKYLTFEMRDAIHFTLHTDFTLHTTSALLMPMT